MIYQHVVLKLARVDAVWVVDGAIPLHDSDASGTRTVQVTHAVQPDVPKTLCSN